MNFSSALGLTIACLMVLSAYAESEPAPAVQCYVCNSNDDASCDDDYQPQQTHAQDCTNGETFCRKTIQTVLGKTSIVRQCAAELYKENYEGCYKTAGKSTQKVCTCEAKNGMPCNTGVVTSKSSFSAVILSVVVAKLFL